MSAAKDVERSIQSQPNGRMYIAIATAMAGAIMFGLDQGNFGNVQSFKSFREQWCLGHYGDYEDCFGARYEQNHAWHNRFVLWGASLITIGAAVGAFTVGPLLSEGYGRRPCISAGGLICAVGCVMAAYLHFRSVMVFMIGRFITGFGVGICCFALPVYNAEVATPGVRGMTGSFFQLFVVIGCFIATLITLAYQGWQFGMVLPGLAGLAVGLAIWVTPESPRYVMKKKGFAAGLEELKKVRSGDVTREAEDMLAEIDASCAVKQVSLGELFTLPGLRYRVFIACWLQIAQQLTGVNAFLGYASTLFSGVGMDNPFMFNVIWNMVMVAGCVAGLLLVDSDLGGRRTQLLAATWLMGPPLVVAGLAVGLHWPGSLTAAMVILYGLGFQLAWGIVPWIYPSEIFAMAEKERAVSLAVFCEFAANGAVVVVTPLIMSWSVAGTLLVFGLLNVLNLVFVYGCIKETKGYPLEAIPKLFDSSSKEVQEKPTCTLKDLPAADADDKSSSVEIA